MDFRLAAAVFVLIALRTTAAVAQVCPAGYWCWCEPARAYWPYVANCVVPWRLDHPHPYGYGPYPMPTGQTTPAWPSSAVPQPYPQTPVAGAPVSPAQQNPTTGEFSSYPASGPVYNGAHALPDLSSPDNYSFRTRITAASRETPNFAGRYVLSFWGCGTGCAQGVIVNVVTGKLVWLPGSFILEPLDAERYEYRVDSRLLIINGHETDGDTTPYAPRCYILEDDDGQPRLTKTTCAVAPVHSSQTTASQPIASPKEGYGGYVQNMQASSPVISDSPPTQSTAPSYNSPVSSTTGGTSSAISSAVILFIVFALAAYFLPTIIAVSRHHHNAPAIFLLNLFLGWTFLGWVLSLVWAATAVTRREVRA